jgi:hypothetical protein
MMNILKKITVGLGLIVLSTLSLSAITPSIPVFAGPDPDSCPPTSGFLDFPNWNRGLKCKQKVNGQGNNVTYTEMDDIPKFVWTVVLNIVDILLRVAGIVAVVMILFNGFQYLSSGGQTDKIAAAKKGLLQTIVGLLIAVMSVAIISFIVGWI